MVYKTLVDWFAFMTFSYICLKTMINIACSCYSVVLLAKKAAKITRFYLTQTKRLWYSRFTCRRAKTAGWRKRREAWKCAFKAMMIFENKGKGKKESRRRFWSWKTDEVTARSKVIHLNPQGRECERKQSKNENPWVWLTPTSQIPLIELKGLGSNEISEVFGPLRIYHGEFDPGSERTLAARLKHASRTAWGSLLPQRVADWWVTRGWPTLEMGIAIRNSG